ncbi:TetR/AcrR family transcriptional regulator C-terminal domain-containing protein [Spiractinospora alimapuensis]|uniref:TetR/AcrR family transcriptional regulator C-terminal domain-containing protein n=1 Tax=Spiractinospora alimapuensis TaxID=2820884 RepID=UPI001F1AF3BB|nr:TetR/AcrR family transcriptional regulator C-terminal domain-containing protein [Spiractinospora alimapuensis]QVQ50802.1 TetR/AcrR family transcriptional regulator C-terminal domain-containing protein [Spiractinospora alimapuensis]
MDVTLEREDVVRTGLRLLDEVGLDKLTLHRLAAELGVQAPALYWHFSGKRDLLDAMATTVLMDATQGDPQAHTGMSWEEFVRECGIRLRAGLMRYRDGARMVPGMPPSAAATGRAQWSHHVLTAVGFTTETAAAALQAVYCFTVGYAAEEQAALGHGNSSTDTEDDVRTGPEAPNPAGFEHGLSLIIDGLRAQVTNAPRP